MAKVIVMRIWGDKVKNIDSFKAASEVEIKTLDGQIDEFINLIPTARSESIRTRYETKVEELDQRIKELKKGAEIKKDPNFEDALDLVLKFLGTPAETWQNTGRELKTMVHSMIFTENPKYSLKTGFGTPKITLPFRIKHYTSGKNSGLVELRGVAPLSSRYHLSRLHDCSVCVKSFALFSRTLKRTMRHIQ